MKISDSIFPLPTQSVTYVTPSIRTYLLFPNLTDFIGCLYIVHLYFFAQSSPAMAMSLPVSTRTLIRYFRYLTNARIDLLVAYRTNILRPWCSVRSQLYSTLVCYGYRRRTVLGKTSSPTTASASILIQSCFGPGRSRCFEYWPSSIWLRQLSPQLSHFLRISSTFFLVFSISMIRPFVGFRGALCGCSSAAAHDFGIWLSNL